MSDSTKLLPLDSSFLILCNSTYKSGSNVLKNLNAEASWFKQLGQTELTRVLERDLQSISWTSSFLIGVYLKFYTICYLVQYYIVQ